MLKIEIKDGPEPNSQEVGLEVTGSLSDILLETETAINSIYTGLVGHDPQTARKFQRALSLMILLPGSPIWDPERGDKKGTVASIRIPKGGTSDD